MMNLRSKSLALRFLVLWGGLVLYAIGLVLCMQANIGFSPWDVFHKGLSLRTGLSIGQISMITGAVIVLFDIRMKEKIGIGTILNVFFIGIFIDLVLDSGLIPQMTGLIPGIAMMLLGLLIVGFATLFYIAAGFGAGPRDGLMLALIRVSGKGVALVRNLMEIVVTVLGYFLGGPVGLGTLLTALTMGYFVKLAFSLFRFDAAKVRHQYLSFDFLKGRQAEAEGSSGE